MSDSNAMYCAKHPKVETYLRCASCNTPICEKCSVMTSVGMKCNDCGTYKHAVICTPSALQVLAAFGVGLVGGAIGGALLPGLGFFLFFLGIAYGRFVGTMIFRASGRKVGLLMDVVTVISIVLGTFGARVFAGVMAFQQSIAQQGAAAAGIKMSFTSMLLYLQCPYTILVAIIVSAAAVSRLRMSWNYWGF